MDNSNSATNDFMHLRDVMGTLPMLKRYISLCLCFVVEDSTSTEAVATQLRTGLDRLAGAFPFLAGQVILQGKTETKSAVPVIKPLSASIQLVHKDLRALPTFPSMAEMKRAGYPFSALDPDTIEPSIARTWTTDESGVTAPVLLLQANYVTGGLLLLVVGNHMIMDMTGMGIVIDLLAKACRNESFTAEEIQQGNQPRANVIPLLTDDYEPGSELDDVTMPPPIPVPPEKDHSAKPAVWAYFNFRSENLRRLKEESSHQTLTPYISTDDAIGAVCWQRVAYIREPRLGRSSESTLCRPISLRRYFELRGYIGHTVDCVYDHETDVWTKPLGEVAARLRLLLQEDESIRHHAQAFATLLDRLDDKTKLASGARLDPKRDLVVSSWTNITCCSLSFGQVLRQPDAARAPLMSPWPFLCFVMPKSREGDIAVALCLAEDEMARLRDDAVFRSYADFVG